MQNKPCVQPLGIERAIDQIGLTALAALLGEKPQTVSNWRARGEPPAHKVLAVEAVTGISRRELCSDWAKFWPEAEAAKA